MTRDGDPERDADAREQAEAAALAEALEGRGRALAELDGGADDAFEAAALLRYGEGSGELASGRAEAVLEGLLAAAPGERAGAARSAGARRWWLWLPLATAASAATAGVLMLASPEAPSTAGTQATSPAAPRAAGEAVALPTPSAALLAAQAERARPGGEAETLAREMRNYRGQLLHALEARYPSPLGMLTPHGTLARRTP